ncbi:hypothetical protein LTR95_001029 [Oleoguttula sp. CCFEE 5521]
MGEFAIWLAKKEQLEEQRLKQKSMIDLNKAAIVELETHMSDDRVEVTAKSVYITEIELRNHESTEMQASVAGIDSTLKIMHDERKKEVERFDDADKWERFEVYNNAIKEKISCMERDKRLMEQLECEIQRLHVDHLRAVCPFSK